MIIFGSKVETKVMPLANIKASIADADTDRYIYLRSRIITCDEPNGNGDFLPKEEVQKSWKTFVGKIVDYNHDTSFVMGKIIDANYIEGKDEEKDYVDIICKIDKQCPKTWTTAKQNEYKFYIQRIEADDLCEMSMEAYAENAECPYCAAKFPFADPCEHVRDYMNAKIEAEDGSEVYIYRIDRDITFAGAGIVENPADKTAQFKNVIATDKEEEEKKEEKVESKKKSTIEALQDISGLDMLKIIDALDHGEERAEKIIKDLLGKIEEPIFENELNKYLDKRLTSGETRKIKSILIEEEKMIAKGLNAHLIKLNGERAWLITKNLVPIKKAFLKDIWGEDLNQDVEIDGIKVSEYAVSDIFKRRLLMAMQSQGIEFLDKVWTATKDTNERKVEDVLKIESKQTMKELITASKERDDFTSCVLDNKENKDITAIEGQSQEEAIEAHCFKQVIGIKASLTLKDIYEKDIPINPEVVGGEDKFKAWLKYKNTGRWPTMLADRIRLKMFARNLNELSEEDKDIFVKASNLMKFGFDVEDVKKYHILVADKDVQKLQKHGFTIGQMKDLFDKRFSLEE